MDGNIHLSFDIDWAPEFVLEDLLTLLSAVKIPCTFFHTHRNSVVDRFLGLPRAECAIHPNFTGGTEDPAAQLRILQADFPSAKGVRCHRLYFHSGLLACFHLAGLRYLSNDLRFLETGLRPHFDWSGMVRIPIYWEDDVHAVYFGGPRDLNALNLEKEGLKVFNFHPIHIYLNTSGLAEYQEIKNALVDEPGARKHRRGGRGIRTLFLELLRRMEGEKSSTLAELADDFERGNRYEGRFQDYLARSGGGGSS